MNKNDLFEKKVQHSDIKNFFPASLTISPSCLPLTSFVQDYDGEAGDAKGGREYFKKRFARLAQKANAKEREIYIQYVRLQYCSEKLLPSA